MFTDPHGTVREQINDDVEQLSDSQQLGSSGMVETRCDPVELSIGVDLPRSRPQRALKIPNRFNDCYIYICFLSQKGLTHTINVRCKASTRVLNSHSEILQF